MTDPNKGRDKAVEVDTSGVSPEEVSELGELLESIQRFIMSIDFRLRQLEAVIYAAMGVEDEDESLEGQVDETPPISLLIPIDEGDEAPAPPDEAIVPSLPIDPVGEQLAALEQVLGTDPED